LFLKEESEISEENYIRDEKYHANVKKYYDGKLK